MRRAPIIGLLVSLLAGCSPDLKNGHYACASDSDCPTDWVCGTDQRCYDHLIVDAAVDRDTGPADLGGRDATPDTGSDAASDVGPRPDADPLDVGPSDVGQSDAFDSGDDAGFDAGEDTGQRPDTGAPDIGTPDSGCDNRTGGACSTMQVCGGTYDCNGVCLGGPSRPMCQCGMASCVGGSWTACPAVPPDIGMICNSSTTCGGIIDCSGTCAGGMPLLSCPQCGVPTCPGFCAMGLCGASSSCDATNGTCQCAPTSNCSCGGATNTTCELCNGTSITFCDVDAYGCGTLQGVMVLCTLGCFGDPPVCLD